MPPKDTEATLKDPGFARSRRSGRTCPRWAGREGKSLKFKLGESVDGWY